MYNFSEDAIREAAYYIWKNNGCQANTSLSDWDAAISQLSAKTAYGLKAPKKASSVKVLMPKKAAAKSPVLHNVKSIVLKPASSLKTTSSSSCKKSTKKTTCRKTK